MGLNLQMTVIEVDVIEGFYCISIRTNVVFKLFSFLGTLVLFSRSDFDHSKTDVKGPNARRFFLSLIFYSDYI